MSTLTPSGTASGERTQLPRVTTTHAAVRGRTRLHVRGLKGSKELERLLEQLVSQVAFVERVSASALTGTVLVMHAADLRAEQIRAGVEVCASRGLAAQSDLAAGLLAPSVAPDWHVLTVDETLERLGSARGGLTTAEAVRRLREHGANMTLRSEPRSPVGLFFEQLRSMPNALLSASAVLSIATGGVADAVLIAGVILANACIGYVTERRADKTVDGLADAGRGPSEVLRDGKRLLVPSEALVQGDILVLRAGQVNADARIIEGERITADESMLTGESLPVQKTPRPLGTRVVPIADRANLLFRGTVVTGGTGLGVVVATGPSTEIGKIQKLAGSASAPETPLQRQMRELGDTTVLVSSLVCGGVFVLGLWRGYGLLQMMKMAASLVVAAVPEGLPTVAITTLSLGMRNMLRERAVIRKLEAVETLGATQVVCLDKTGTITLNQMNVVAVFAGMTSLRIEGEFPPDEALAGVDLVALARLTQLGVLCNESKILREGAAYRFQGSATENALMYFAVEAGIDVSEVRAQYPCTRMELRTEERHYTISEHTEEPLTEQAPRGQELRSPRRLIAVKGSPEQVLRRSTHWFDGGDVRPLTEEQREQIERQNHELAVDALRVLAFAFAELDEGADSGEAALVWVGLAGLRDPPRQGIGPVIMTLREAGIQTVMMTGDQATTAQALGRELGFGVVVDASVVETLDDHAMRELIASAPVFARVSPSDKLRIIQAIQRSGLVVAMVGDGINDSPALKAADIGIAMGGQDTPVACEAADVVLMDDNPASIVTAIRQGRAIRGNLRKAVRYLLATNLSEIWLMLGAMAANWGQPLNPLQLLWINLVTDVLPDLALALEPPEPGVMSDPPPPRDEPLLDSGDMKQTALESLVITAGALATYGYGIRKHGQGARASSMAFLGLTSAQLLHTFSARTENHNMFSMAGTRAGRHVWGTVGASLGAQMLAAFWPRLRRLLGGAPLSLLDFAVAAGGAVVPLMFNETMKARTRHHTQRGRQGNGG
jgi:P-type Ca2+ transporter type 2C